MEKNWYTNGEMILKFRKKSIKEIVNVILEHCPWELTYHNQIDPYKISDLRIQKIKKHFVDGVCIPKQIKILHVDGRILCTWKPIDHEVG